MDNQVYNQSPESNKGKAIASMVMGICSIVFTCSGPVSIVLGILAMNFAKKYIEENGEIAFAKVGKITGLIGMICGILGCLYWGFYIVIAIIAAVAN